MEEKDCVFCKIAKGEIKAEKILENDNFFVIDDANPKTKGHCLVIAKKHYKTILDIPSTLGTELLSLIKESAIKKLKENKAEGFNMIMNNFETAGQVVHHAHIHIIPRYKKDGFKICT